MKLKIYMTKDVIVGAFMQPMYAFNNDNEAKRAWGGSIMASENDPRAQINIKDLQLYRLGEFDDETGKIEPEIQAEFVTSSAEYLGRRQNYEILQRNKQTNDNTNAE